VTDFVLNDTSEKPDSFKVPFFAVPVVTHYRYSFLPFNGSGIARNTQTTLHPINQAITYLIYARIDEYNGSTFQIYDHNLSQDANLRSGKTDTLGPIHGYEHFIDQCLQFISKYFNWFCLSI
jgi:hypothetical protein